MKGNIKNLSASVKDRLYELAFKKRKIDIESDFFLIVKNIERFLLPVINSRRAGLIWDNHPREWC